MCQSSLVSFRVVQTVRDLFIAFSARAQLEGVEFPGDLGNRQALRFGNVPDGEVEEERRRRDEEQERIGLGVLEKYGEGERDEPVRDPVDEDADRHRRVPGPEREDLGNDEPRDAAGTESEEDDHARHRSNGDLQSAEEGGREGMIESDYG